MIDAGTEGFKAHTRVVFAGVTSCLECTVELWPPTEKVPLCTVAATPRNAAHCIQYAALIAWDRVKPFDDPNKKKDANENAAAEGERERDTERGCLFLTVVSFL